MSEQPDLPELEMAFAKDPSKFVALTTAYIQHGRFMEAMVVCKKGIKSQPDSTEGRLLLARVYSEQGKIPKAMEELKGLLEQKPDSADGHFFMGQMLEKTGKFDEAIESFKEALRKDRKHEGAAAALKAKGIDWSPGPSPEEIAAAEAAKKAAEEAAAAEAKRKMEEESAAAEAAWKAQQAAQAPAPSNGVGMPSSSGMGRPRATSQVPRQASGPVFPNDPAFASTSGAYGMYSGPVPVAGSQRRLGPGFTFGLGALLLVVVVVVVLILKHRHDNQQAIAEHYKVAKKSIESDTTKGLRDGVKELEEALKVDDSEPRVVAKYAWALADLWYERGEKDLDSKAKEAAKRAAKYAGDQHESIGAQMIIARSESKFDDAIKLARSMGTDDQMPLDVRAELGRTYAAMGKVPEMVKIADSMKDVTDAMALTFVGEAYRRIGDHGRARIELDAAIKNNLDHDPSRALRAMTILEDDDITNLNIAIDDLKSVKDLGKEAAGTKQRGYAALGLAIVGKKIGRPQRDIDTDLASAKSLLGGDPEVPLFDAKQALDEEPAKAIPLAEAAIKADRVRLAPYLVIVDAASAMKSFAPADKALADATAVFGDNLYIGLAKAQRLTIEGRFDDAVAGLKTMIPAHDVAEVYRDIGKVFTRAEKYSDAVDWLKKAADKAKTRSPAIQANVFLNLGKAYQKSGDPKTAFEIFGQCVSVDGDYAPCFYYLATSAKEAKMSPAISKEACGKYLQRDPNGHYAKPCREEF